MCGTEEQVIPSVVLKQEEEAVEVVYETKDDEESGIVIEQILQSSKSVSCPLIKTNELNGEFDKKMAALDVKIATKTRRNKVKAEKKKTSKALEAQKKIDPSKKALFVKSVFTVKSPQPLILEPSTRVEDQERSSKLKSKVVEIEQKKMKKLIKPSTVEYYGKASTSKASTSPIVNSKSETTSALPKQVKAKKKSK
jgi:hypothetical protein